MRLPLFIILIIISWGCKVKKNIQTEYNESMVMNDFESVKGFYFNNLGDKERLKIELANIVHKNPVENSNLFALFVINSEEPFFFMGGATYNEIGKYVRADLFKKVSLHLLEHLETSKDHWFDIQQIGRWVNEDFVPRGKSDLNHREKIKFMIDRMMNYFEREYKIKNVDNKR